ncbi:MAG: YkgJ family cysteine cluster protein [Phycisphaerae bacterium]|nr:YkgJ family cysteine cluster protein [Phycisphaerae bacterium]
MLRPNGIAVPPSINPKSCLCDECAALCCRYFALPIDNPTCVKDYDHIRWYLCHENVVAFIEKKQWYVAMLSRCKYLQADNRCGIYETRPRVCRSYSTENCDYHGGEYDFDVLFTSAEQLREFAEKKLNARRRAGKRRISLVPQPRATARLRRRKYRGHQTLSLPVIR